MSTILSKAANQFGVELFQCYLSRHGDKYKNLLLCPYLIYHSLAMMLVGAKGKTAEQLHKLLKIPTNNSNYGYNINRYNLGSLGSSTLSVTDKNPRPQSAKRAGLRCSRKQPKSLSPIKSSSSQSNESRNALSNAVSPKSSPASKPTGRISHEEGQDDARHKEFLMLTEQLIHGNFEFVHLASFIYLDKSTKRTEYFKTVLKDYYETKPKKIDFDDVDLVVKTVNEDVKRTTENIYNEILTRQEAQKMEKSYMLLVNAVFFRGFWLSNFTDVKKAAFVKYLTQEGQPQAPEMPVQSSMKENQTHNTITTKEKSNSSPKPSILRPKQFSVNMMSKLDYLPVLKDDQLDARIIKMPFEASDLQMLIILPNNKESDSTYLCHKLSATKINSIVQQFSKSKSRTVQVSMPIFCVDSGKISIQSTLVTMGAGDLFNKSRADMSGVCEDKKIWLHKILHRCFIICDNRGSITSSNFEKAKRRQAKLDNGITAGRKGVEEFVANHPFMYIIMDSVTNTILIMGLYTDPSETIEIVHENQLSAEEAHQIYTEGVYKT